MSFNSLIKSEQIRIQLIKSNKIFFFMFYIDLDNSKIFEFRIFLKQKNISFLKLNTKQINRLIKACFINDVVLKLNNKNIDLRAFNLSVLSLNDFFMFVYFLNYVLHIYMGKIYPLYFKINTAFYNINFLKKNLKNFFFPNEFNKITNFFEIKNFINYQSLFLINKLKIIYFKIFLGFKLFFLFKITFYIIKNIILK